MNLHMWQHPRKTHMWKVYSPAWKKKWCLHMNLTACITPEKCLKDILSSTTLNADGMHWEGFANGILEYIFFFAWLQARSSESWRACQGWRSHLACPWQVRKLKLLFSSLQHPKNFYKQFGTVQLAPHPCWEVSILFVLIRAMYRWFDTCFVSTL